MNFHSFSIHFVLLEMFGAELQGLRREHQRREGPPAKQPHVTIGFRKGQHKPYLHGVNMLKPRHDCTSISYITYVYLQCSKSWQCTNDCELYFQACWKACVAGGWRRASQREDLTWLGQKLLNITHPCVYVFFYAYFLFACVYPHVLTNANSNL